jgi:transcriptional regulator GlxA family with amidase domain
VHYLTQWRMQCASLLSRETQASVASIGSEAGYVSENASARAFKLAVGLPTAGWRRQTEIALRSASVDTNAES